MRIYACAFTRGEARVRLRGRSHARHPPIHINHIIHLFSDYTHLTYTQPITQTSTLRLAFITFPLLSCTWAKKPE